MAKNTDLLDMSIQTHQHVSVHLCRAIIELSLRREDLLVALEQGCAVTEEIRRHILDDQKISRTREAMSAYERKKFLTLRENSEYRDRIVPLSELELKKSGFSLSKFIDLAIYTIEKNNLDWILFQKPETGMVTQDYFDIISYTNPVLYFMNRQYKSYNRNIESERLFGESKKMVELVTQIEESAFECLSMERTIRKGIARLQTTSINPVVDTGPPWSSQKTSIKNLIATLEDHMEVALGVAYEVHGHKGT